MNSSFFAETSPLGNLIATFALLVPVLLSFDPYTPLAFLAIGLFELFVLGRVPLRRIARTIGPLLALPAGLFLLNLLFSTPEADAQTYRVWIVQLSSTGLHRALVLALRSLALIVISVGYLLVTDPQELVGSLMQQAGLSPRIGYSIYVAWNTIPLLRDNLRQIENAHRVRLQGSPRSLRDALPTAVALLTGAIRHAERASLSMAARGIESAGERTYLRESRWRLRDTLYLAASFVLSAAMTVALIEDHLFVFGLG